MKLIKIKKYIDNNIYNLLKNITDKNILFTLVNDNLQYLYSNLTNKNYIFIFDIEFINYLIDKINYNYIFEIGGIIIHKYNNKWYIIAFFNYNIKPIYVDNNMYLLNSEYSTISNETYNKIKKYEFKLLPHNIYTDIKNINIDELFKNKLVNKFLSKDKIYKLYKDKNYKKIHKELKQIIFKINGNNLLNNKLKYEFNLYNKINNLILNDPDINNRYVDKIKNNLILLKKIIINGYSIVKGTEDFKAITNTFNIYNIKQIQFIDYFDIAKFNKELYELCNSAELKNTFDCLMQKKLISYNDDIYLELKKYKYIKAHNPLVDSFMTLIIFNYYFTK